MIGKTTEGIGQVTTVKDEMNRYNDDFVLFSIIPVSYYDNLP